MGGGRLCKGEGLLAGFVGGGSDLCDFQCPKKDVENQAGNAAVAQRLAEFQRDPKAWLGSHLNPQLGEHTPKGYEAFFNATNDWSTWLPRKE